MKKLLLAVFAGVLILGSAVVAAAMPPVRANIPFAFHVGDALLPAGEYVIRTTGHSVGTTYMIGVHRFIAAARKRLNAGHVVEDHRLVGIRRKCLSCPLQTLGTLAERDEAVCTHVQCPGVVRIQSQPPFSFVGLCIFRPPCVVAAPKKSTARTQKVQRAAKVLAR